MKTTLLTLILLCTTFITVPAVFASENQHAHEEHDEVEQNERHEEHEEHEEGISFNKIQKQLVGIEVTSLVAQHQNFELYAPGEVRANDYTSYIVAPRTKSLVLKRHVSQGENVQIGQPLVTLFSEAIAKMQGRYQISFSEWKRVQRLGRKNVGERRYIEAKTEFQEVNSKLKAMGMSNKAINQLAKAHSSKLGEFTLFSEISGTVLHDSFTQGQLIEAGTPLMKLIDEDSLWVIASLPATNNTSLASGLPARVVFSGETFDAKVLLEAHAIEEITRTRQVRLVVNNDAHRLHPGMYVDVYFQFKTEKPVLAVPETALIRGDEGDWHVFVEEEQNKYKPVEVGLGRSFGEWREISGIQMGSKVVTQGSFFIASQIAKESFGDDDHGH